jgi:Xaa-Pro aminopeptidase
MRVAPADAHVERLRRLHDLLASATLDALVVTSLPNIAYLTGFFASAAALVVTPEALVLIGDGRYAESLQARAREWSAIRTVQLGPGVSYDEAVVDVLEPLDGLRVGFEATHLTVRRHQYFVATLEARGWVAALHATDGLVEQLRVRKDSWEIATLRAGGERLSHVAKCILSDDVAGRTESAIAGRIDDQLRRVGFERPSFDTIVASGPNAALPHARAGSRRVEAGDLVVLDFGGVLDGYCTDLTRTIVAGGHLTERQRQMVGCVITAQAAAFAAVKPGAKPESVDAAAREVLRQYGLEEAFAHGTGHGLGLEIHESPRVGRMRSEHAEPLLEAGSVLTLEPGVYLPGWGGVRIEDDVLVTEDGAEWLTDVPREV